MKTIIESTDGRITRAIMEVGTLRVVAADGGACLQTYEYSPSSTEEECWHLVDCVAADTLAKLSDFLAKYGPDPTL